MQHPFDQLRSEYDQLLSTCVITRGDEADQIVLKHILPNMPRYVAAVAGLTTPPALIACLHWRESDGDFKTYLGNGERLDRVTKLVPRGRGPWDTWEAGAADAIRYDHLDIASVPWSPAYALYRGEGYNGFGPRAHGIHTGYLWAGTNVYVRGKYTETPAGSTWNPLMVDQQMGVAPLLLKIAQWAPQYSIPGGPEFDHQPPIPAPQPVPEGVGGLKGAEWVQASLNKVLHLDPPLAVDGSYGRLTRAAVREFQSSHGLVANGLVDDQFCTKMDAALAA